MRKKIPYDLIKISNGLRFVAFVVIFAFTFILIFAPYGSPKFEAVTSVENFAAHAALVSAIGLVVLIISRFILFLFCRTRDLITYATYIIWIVVEIVAISLFCNLYAWLVGKYYYNLNIGYFQIIGDTMLYCTSILVIPYIIVALYFELADRNKYIEHFRKRSGIIAERDDQTQQILFSDEKGNLRLSVHINNLFYIEAANNYVNICYKNKERTTKFCLRNSLKNIETMCLSGDLVRCHRSYIINFPKVKVLKREKNGLFVELDDKDIPDIPVSKTFAQQLMDKFSQ